MRRTAHLLARGAAPWLAAAGCLLLVACSNGEGSLGAGNSSAKTNEFTQVVIQTTEGNIRFEMLQPEAPNTVAGMAALILTGTYDDKTFFQRQDGAFLQFGDPDSEASLTDPIAQEITGEPMDRGMVALAWVGSRARTSHRLIFPLSRLDARLDTQYTVFGRVLEGMDVLDRIQAGTGIQRITTRLNRPIVRIITQKGNIIIEMAPEFAPQTVERISDLVCQGFYDGITFWRVEDFLIQGGDPNGDGTGGSGTTLPAEINNGRFFRGAVGMARQPGDLDSADSQFFIMKRQQTDFDSLYTYFGEVIAGMDVVDVIEAGDVMNTVTLQFDLQGRDCQASDAPPPDDAGFNTDIPGTT
jgi:cyclophilin family peptidyl-prolyl cis-trans isomerase